MPTPNQAAANPPVAEPSSAAVDSPTDILHFNKWLAVLGERKASDLHLTVGNVPALRVDGAIMPMEGEDIITAERIQRIVDSILEADELALLAREREIIISRTLAKTLRFRIHVFYSRSFPAVSLRHLPAEEQSAVQLGLPEAVVSASKSASGFLLITGPFDSGKTATVRSLLSDINHNEPKYIVTLEKPIEYLLASDKAVVVQRQVGRDAASFAAGLANLADEDVNVVAVSSLPDAAACSETLKLAASGRLVMAVLTSPTCLDALEGLAALFPPSERERVLDLLADTLLAIVAQLLLLKVAGGRVLISEVLLATAPVKSLIREGKFRQIPQIMQTSRAQGMSTMDQALAEAVKAGTVALQTAHERAIDANQFNLLVSH